MIALVDCNNFFASCERLFRPDLKNKPVLVLSNNDGCVVARSEEVKKLGIPMGVPYFKVKNIVEPNNVVCFSSNFSLYSNISGRIQTILASYAPSIEIYSIDEAFLDLNSLAVKDWQKWGDNLAGEVLHSIGMPVSVGIAPTKTLAKLASSYAKKQKTSCILIPGKEAFQEVLESFEVGNVWGVGPQLAKKFQNVGVKTAWQLYNTSEEWLKTQIGITGSRMWRELHGFVAYKLEIDTAPQKSLMASRSFGHTVSNYHELQTAVASFASQAAFKLRCHNQTTQVFGIYLRYKTKEQNFGNSALSTPLEIATNDTSELTKVALLLLEKLYEETHGYKKAGVFAHHLASSAVTQMSLLKKQTESERSSRKELMKALDEINQRFGSNTIHIGSIDTRAKRWHSLKKRISPSYTTNWTELPKVVAG